LQQCREEEFSLRYAGAMVDDVHRVLLTGGIFMYPPTTKSPVGKLRLMYEANPMAMIIEQTGGGATTGECKILDIDPLALHQRIPVVLDSPDNVTDLFNCLGDEPCC
jgi:fructose-1,6-bisphosphatase I